MTPEMALRSLHDVTGVIGSFVASQSGDLLSSDMPAFVEAQELGRVGPRLCSILDSFREAGVEEPQQVVLRFNEHHLFVRLFDSQMLCVLSDPQVSLPALRMASKLACRQLADAETTDTVPPPSLPPSTLRSNAIRTPLPSAPPPTSVAPPPTFLVPSSLAPRPGTSNGAPESRSRHQQGTAPSPPRTIVFRGRKYEV